MELGGPDRLDINVSDFSRLCTCGHPIFKRSQSAAAARELTEDLLRKHPNLCGLFISGGGITGALAALRNTPKRHDFVAVGYELFDDTRTALIDGTLTMAISHPLDQMAKEAIATMINAVKARTSAGALRVALGFDIYTSENV